MEKEIIKDEMLAAYMETMGIPEETTDETTDNQEETTEEQETQEETATEEEQSIEETQEETVEEETKAETETNVEEKVEEEVDNSEWLKDFEAVLLKKNEYKSLSPEQKALAYLKEQHPFLDENDLIFKAASEFGIGATPLSEEDLELLSDAEKRELKAQEIKRKELLHTAEQHLKSQSEALELPKIPNPLEKDEGYKSYKEMVAKQAEEQKLMKKEMDRINQDIDNTSVKIEKIEIEPKITLDDSEFTFKSEFKLDENKRKELAQYAKEYTPTKAEADLYFPQDGKFNMEGYLSHLATIKFQKQIINAAVKEGIAKAREEFVEKDLKNSTLRNNQTMQQSNREVDAEIAAMRA